MLETKRKQTSITADPSQEIKMMVVHKQACPPFSNPKITRLPVRLPLDTSLLLFFLFDFLC